MSKIGSELPNSEILLIYEAKNCNPNGDPDAENRPRMDPKTGVNLVSDVRLKRYFRDYVVEKFGEDYIYVTKIGGESRRADDRVKSLLKIGEGSAEDIGKRIHEVLQKCIDARLFGATIPIGKGGEERGAARSFTGPVQFTWGFSFHRVELIDSPSITSVFSGREESERYGTIGKDWRIYYSLIGFYGVVSGRRAVRTYMSENDLKVLDNLLWTALQNQPTTRSKIGERPHLYLRLEYKNADTVLGDLRRFVEVRPKSEVVRDFEDLEFDFNGLAEHIAKNSALLSKVYLRTSDEMSFLEGVIKGTCQEKVYRLPHELTDQEVERIIKGETR